MPIDPAMAVTGPEWTIQAPEAPSAPGAADGVEGAGRPGGFGDLLASSMDQLTAAQTQASSASQALAAGADVDPTSVVMAVERARLSMQLASQVRTKAVEAYQDVFHTQV
jgi:flagellar hook-basal body complex protein FliE